MEKVQNSKLTAEEYFKFHGLEEFVQDMFNTTLHEKPSKPNLFMLKYLVGRLSDEEREKAKINVGEGFIAPELVPIVKFPILDSKSMVSKYLTKEKWNEIKYKITSFGNRVNTIFSDNDISLPDPNAYDVFISFLHPLAIELNDCKNTNVVSHGKKDGFKNELELIKSKELEGLINSVSKQKIEYFIKMNRNIKGYAFLQTIKNISELNQILHEALSKQNFKKSDANNFKLFNDCKSEANHKSNLEFLHNDKINCTVVLNNNDHLEFYINSKNIISGLEELEKLEKNIGLEFEQNLDFGYLSHSLTSCAYGIEIHSKIKEKSDENIFNKIETQQAKILQSKEEILVVSKSLIGVSLSSLVYYHLNTLSSIFLILKKKSVDKLNEKVFNSSKFIFYNDLNQAYLSKIEEYKSLQITEQMNINSLVKLILEQKPLEEMSYLKYYYDFFTTYFSNFFNTSKNYFYDYSKENFSVLKQIPKHNLISFSFELHRLVKGTFSKDYLERNLTEEQLVKVEVIPFQNLSISSEFNQVKVRLFDLEAIGKLKEILSYVHTKTSIIFNVISHSFATDNLIGFINTDIRTCGSGFRLGFTIKSEEKVKKELENNKKKFQYEILTEGDILQVEMITFGKFINKTVNDFISLLEVLNS